MQDIQYILFSSSHNSDINLLRKTWWVSGNIDCSEKDKIPLKMFQIFFRLVNINFSSFWEANLFFQHNIKRIFMYMFPMLVLSNCCQVIHRQCVHPKRHSTQCRHLWFVTLSYYWVGMAGLSALAGEITGPDIWESFVFVRWLEPPRDNLLLIYKVQLGDILMSLLVVSFHLALKSQMLLSNFYKIKLVERVKAPTNLLAVCQNGQTKATEETL